MGLQKTSQTRLQHFDAAGAAPDMISSPEIMSYEATKALYDSWRDGVGVRTANSPRDF